MSYIELRVANETNPDYAYEYWAGFRPSIYSTSHRFEVQSRKHDLGNPLRGSPIRVQNECDVPHLAIREFLLERHSEALESLASFLNVRNSHSDVTEASARLSVARRISLKPRIALSPVVMGELQNAYGGESIRT